MKQTLKWLVLGVGMSMVILLLFLVFTETFGAEPNPTGDPIGGGTGYTRIISETDTRVKYVLSTKDQLLSALKSAQSGGVIFEQGMQI